MPSSILFILNILVLLCGAIIFYSAFLYEDAQGKIQSVFEDLWLKIDDLQTRALSRHLAFIHVVFGAATSGLNRVYGKQLFSLQSTIVSICYAIAWFWIAVLLLNVWATPTQVIWDVIFTITFFIVFGTLPAFIKKEKWRLVWLFVFLTLATCEVLAPLFRYVISTSQSKISHLTPLLIIMIISGVMGLASFVLVVALMRSSVRRIASTKSLIKISGLLLVNIAPLIILFVLSTLTMWVLGFTEAPNITDPTTVLMSWSLGINMFLITLLIALFAVNIIFVIISVILVAILLITMFSHRVFWPLIQRPLYVLQRYGVIRQSKLLGILGLILIFYSLGKAGLIIKLLETIKAAK